VDQFLLVQTAIPNLPECPWWLHPMPFLISTL
jgi:hypothetical protein